MLTVFLVCFIILLYFITPDIVFFRFIKLKWLKVAEAGLVAAVTGLAAFVMMISLNTCTDTQPYDSHAIVSKVSLV